MLKLAHRGDIRAAKENTIAALDAACRIPGVHGVEFDVRASADGVPVLSHDDDLARVWGVNRSLHALAAHELQALGIPALAEVLAALPGDAFLDVELKEDVAEAARAPLVEARGEQPSRAVLSSFDGATLQRAREVLPDWPRWLVASRMDDPLLEAAVAAGCAAVVCDYHALDSRAIRKARERGLAVVSWAISRRPTLARLERLGVWAACVEGAALAG